MEEIQTQELEIIEKPYANLSNLSSLIKNWLQKDLDVVIAVTGPKGVGKSTLALQIARRISDNFNVERHVAYTFEDIVNRFDELNEFEPLVIDEAVNTMMSEDWNTFQSKYLKKLFAKIRVKHLAIILCIPNFFWLDKKYREDMVNMWIHVIRRGLGVIFLPNLSISEDKWDKKWFEKHNIRFSYFTKMEKVVDKLKRHPCFFDFVSYPKLPQEIEDKYKTLRREAIFKQSEEDMKGKTFSTEMLKKMFTAYKLRQEGRSYEEISQITGLAKKTLESYVSIIKKIIEG